MSQVRAAKSSGDSKETIQELVKELLKLKADYKTLTGQDAPAPQQQSCECLWFVSFMGSIQGIIICLKVLYFPQEIEISDFWNLYLNFLC